MVPLVRATISWILTTVIVASSPTGSVAGDTWNMIVQDSPETEAASREASAKLLQGVAAIFNGLASSERREYDSAREWNLAAFDSLRGASTGFAELSKNEAALRKINTERISQEERSRLLDWYNKVSSEKATDPSDLTVSDLLSAASEKTFELANVHQEAFSDVSLEDSERTGRLYTQMSELLIIGTIASRVFIP